MRGDTALSNCLTYKQPYNRIAFYTSIFLIPQDILSCLLQIFAGLSNENHAGEHRPENGSEKAVDGDFAGRIVPQ